jgi:hypothetical protein
MLFNQCVPMCCSRDVARFILATISLLEFWLLGVHIALCRIGSWSGPDINCIFKESSKCAKSDAMFPQFES